MSAVFNEISFNTFSRDWKKLRQQLSDNHVFMTPEWNEVWWKHFGGGDELFLAEARHDDTLIGISPLRIIGETAQFIGDASVCDYMDFIVKKGSEKHFYTVLLEALTRRGVKRLILDSLRPQSFVINHLIKFASDDGYKVTCVPHGVSLEMMLPSSWEKYLMTLKQKQRHEVRRKMRRLHEEGEPEYSVYRDTKTVADNIGGFLHLMKESNAEKTRFLTPQMHGFFVDMAKAMAEKGNVGLGWLKIGGKKVAAVLHFDYNDTVYLYNSGYDPLYKSLSVGLLSKALCIKDTITNGRKKFDFLKGEEIYKSRLGGKKYNLTSCIISLA